MHIQEGIFRRVDYLLPQVDAANEHFRPALVVPNPFGEKPRVDFPVPPPKSNQRGPWRRTISEPGPETPSVCGDPIPTQ